MTKCHYVLVRES